MKRLRCCESTTSARVLARSSVNLALLLFCSVVWGLSFTGHAAPSAPTEYEVKAALVYKFAKFVEWPEGAFADHETPVGVCVLGADAVRRALELLSDQRIKGRKVVVRRLDNSFRAFEACHVAFIGAPKPYQLTASLQKFDNRPVLTVGDRPGFAKKGGILGLRNIENRIRFEINLDAIDKAGLVISSQVLSLATTLYGQHQQEVD